LTGKLKAFISKLKGTKIWIDVFAPNKIEVEELHNIFGLEEKQMLNFGSRSIIEDGKNHNYFAFVSYRLDEDNNGNMDYKGNPVMYGLKINFFVF